MSGPSGKGVALADFSPFDEHHYRDLWRRQVGRLLLSYLAPLIVAIAFLTVEYAHLASKSKELYFEQIAASQANTLNLFLMERVANLENLIVDQALLAEPTSEALESQLKSLAGVSKTFGMDRETLFSYDERWRNWVAAPSSTRCVLEYGSQPARRRAG